MNLTDAEAHTNKRRRMDGSVRATPTGDMAVWRLLADSTARPPTWARRAWSTGPSVVSSFGERLGKGIYETAFPPCGRGCVAVLCERLQWKSNAPTKQREKRGEAARQSART
ncbi:hypothetical protein psal_cds_699 [Pandoravirus salinus]|uniref:Uncharacterized protein n=1 Tax=Pandoravirus salinus TaxID=1349410 RepID=S4VWB9_9VIRU|nr:hypothetical protein psal_cds_699 [Pandoravirus salinus]AGO84653.1 hypothetical protein psal_cds_699 [Pandoravirus salinus]